jgi:hypothetical protein
MAAPFILSLDPVKRLTDYEECALLRQAVAGGAASSEVRLRFMLLLNRLDGFAEALTVFDPATAPTSFAVAQALTTAFFGRDEPGDVARACTMAQAAEQLATDDRERAIALVDQGRARMRLSEADAGARALDRALVLDPGNGAALRRRAKQWLSSGDPAAVLRLVDDLATAGVRHVGLLAARARALIMQGDGDAARALLNLDAFLVEQMLVPPERWPDRSAFHAAIAAELSANPAIREGRHGTASIASQRVDDPVRPNTPAFSALAGMIRQAVMAYADARPVDGHLWLAARPERARLRLWAVITGADGWEQWHMHPQGWLSGGYYAAVPDAVVHGQGPAGCLELGLPATNSAADAPSAITPVYVRPRPGLLTLFPSHAYHRTHPHGADAQRICLAFDVMPE